MIYIYRFFYFLFKFPMLVLRPFLSQKTQAWVRLRTNKDFQNINFKNTIWFHASSGEIEYCKSIIREIKRQSPQTRIIISYSSISAEKLFFNIKNEVDFIFPLPWDSPQILDQILRHIQPSALIFSRTDFWPELIHQAQKKNIPLIAISMFPRLHFLSRWTYRWLLKDFKWITTVSEETTRALQKILKCQIQTFSDTRFDQVFSRLESPSKFNFMTSAHRIVFASTWPEDEDQLLPTLPHLIKLGYGIIWAPHEAHRAQILERKLSEYRPQLLSDFSDYKAISMTSPVLIIDQVGYLADIYRSTQWAFVGGSFKQKIHSVMEPVAAGNTVFFGPHFRNNPEAVETEKLGLTYKVHSTDEIVQLLSTVKPHQEALKYAQSQRGSSGLIAQKILYQMNANSKST